MDSTLEFGAFAQLEKKCKFCRTRPCKQLCWVGPWKELPPPGTWIAVKRNAVSDGCPFVLYSDRMRAWLETHRSGAAWQGRGDEAASQQFWDWVANQRDAHGIGRAGARRQAPVPTTMSEPYKILMLPNNAQFNFLEVFRVWMQRHKFFEVEFNELSMVERFTIAALYAIDYIDTDEASEGFRAVINQKNMALLVGIFAVWLLAHGVGIGFIMDGVLLVLAIYMFPGWLTDTFDGLLQFGFTAFNATDYNGLMVAGMHLAKFLNRLKAEEIMVVFGSAGAKIWESKLHFKYMDVTQKCRWSPKCFQNWSAWCKSQGALEYARVSRSKPAHRLYPLQASILKFNKRLAGLLKIKQPKTDNIKFKGNLAGFVEKPHVAELKKVAAGEPKAKGAAKPTEAEIKAAKKVLADIEKLEAQGYTWDSQGRLCTRDGCPISGDKDFIYHGVEQPDGKFLQILPNDFPYRAKDGSIQIHSGTPELAAFMQHLTKKQRYVPEQTHGYQARFLFDIWDEAAGRWVQPRNAEGLPYQRMGFEDGDVILACVKGKVEVLDDMAAFKRHWEQHVAEPWPFDTMWPQNPRDIPTPAQLRANGQNNDILPAYTEWYNREVLPQLQGPRFGR